MKDRFAAGEKGTVGYVEAELVEGLVDTDMDFVGWIGYEAEVSAEGGIAAAEAIDMAMMWMSENASVMVVVVEVGGTHRNRVEAAVHMNLAVVGNYKLNTGVEMREGTWGTVTDRTIDEAHIEVLPDYLAD